MKKAYYLLVPFFALAVGLIFLSNEVKTAFNKIAYYSPCDTPITYSIGTIDSGFNTTADELLEDTKTATNIWNTTQNKTLFSYDPNSNFTVNLVYDDRQELTNKINNLNSDLKQKQEQIDPKINDYKARQIDFENKVKKLNDDISYWNSQGGAPKEEYDQLVLRQEELKKEAAALNAEAKALGQETNEYNSNARYLNSTIDDYQGVLITKPEEGLYEQDGSKKKISIYIDVSHEEFLHTLTHEFGHALGLDHNSDPESIMYPQTNKSLKPSEKDTAELNDICKKRTVFEVFVTRFKEVFKVLQDRFRKSG